MKEIFHGRFEVVPPPASAPLHASAEAHGLPRGLRCEPGDGQYRCAACSRMQPASALQVWVPDGVRRGDASWSVTERARCNAWNGGWSAWCLGCAKTLAPTWNPFKRLCRWMGL